MHGEMRNASTILVEIHKNFKWRRQEGILKIKMTGRNESNCLEGDNLQIFARKVKISVPKEGRYIEQSLNYKFMRKEARRTSVYFLSVHLTNVRFTLRKFHGTVSECRKREQEHASSLYLIVSRWRNRDFIT